MMKLSTEPSPMPARVLTGVLASVLALSCGPALADANEVAKKTASAVETGVVKSEAAVKRGGSAAGNGIERGVRWANDGADKLAAKLGLPKGTAADARKAQDTPQRKADVHPDATLDPVPQSVANPGAAAGTKSGAKSGAKSDTRSGTNSTTTASK
jgi:hypothetical protein